MSDVFGVLVLASGLFVVVLYVLWVDLNCCIGCCIGCFCFVS